MLENNDYQLLKEYKPWFQSANNNWLRGLSVRQQQEITEICNKYGIQAPNGNCPNCWIRVFKTIYRLFDDAERADTTLKHCPTCGKAFDSMYTYCSHECYTQSLKDKAVELRANGDKLKFGGAALAKRRTQAEIKADNAAREKEKLKRKKGKKK